MNKIVSMLLGILVSSIISRVERFFSNRRRQKPEPELRTTEDIFVKSIKAIKKKKKHTVPPAPTTPPEPTEPPEPLPPKWAGESAKELKDRLHKEVEDAKALGTSVLLNDLSIWNKGKNDV